MTVDQASEDDLPFRQLAQDLPTPCWIADAEGRITWVNRAWLDFTGRDVGVLRRDGLAGLHDPQVFPRVCEKWAATRAAGQPDEMVFPLRGTNGAFRPFRTRVVPLRNAAGEVTRWIGTNTDVMREAEAEARARSLEAAVQENEARLRLATDAAGVGVWEWRIDSNEMIYSKRAREICGFDPDVPVTYEMVAAVTHPEDFVWTSAQAARALDPQVRDHSTYEYRIMRGSGEIRWVTASGEAIFAPGDDGELVATRYVGTLIDITGRKVAEDAILESERQLQMALRAGRMAAWRVDSTGAIAPNAELNALLGLPGDSRPTFSDLAPNYLPGELDRIAQAAQVARSRGERHLEVEHRYRRADGQVRWFNLRAETQVKADGAPDGVIGIAMDVTDRKVEEERSEFLALEVDHRANNLMAVVESIVAFSDGETVADLRDVLRGRVQALAKAHRLLAASRWSGAELNAIVREELAPYGLLDAEPRLRASGPEVMLRPASAQAIGMVVHELSTNAAKHGALTSAAGRVDVSWTLDANGTLRIRWRETDGPPVLPPGRQGLGLSVIQRAIVGPLGGDVYLDWRPEGLVADFSLSEP